MAGEKNKSLSKGRKVGILVLAIVVFTGGYILRDVLEHRRADSGTTAEISEGVEKWTCSMHPQIILDKPGKCPICAMDLVRIEIESSAEVTARQLTVSEEAAKLMEIETAVVERRFVSADIRMVGKIDEDRQAVCGLYGYNG
jgi:Cu(I)/Ag(I) efflux system membrane fusion protein